jgi:uncharacterized protein YecT (DUF1311 family)
MHRLWMILLILAATALPARAASAASPDVETIKACLATAGSDPQSCVGTISDECQGQPEGSSTTGIDACLGREHDAWDVILNENYRAAVAAAKEQDASLKEQAIEPGAAASLVKAQRAWVAFRDAECDRRFELYKDGSIRTNIASSCLLQLTASRALDFQSSQ